MTAACLFDLSISIFSVVTVQKNMLFNLWLTLTFDLYLPKCRCWLGQLELMEVITEICLGNIHIRWVCPIHIPLKESSLWLILQPTTRRSLRSTLFGSFRVIHLYKQWMIGRTASSSVIKPHRWLNITSHPNLSSLLSSTLLEKWSGDKVRLMERTRWQPTPESSRRMTAYRTLGNLWTPALTDHRRSDISSKSEESRSSRVLWLSNTQCWNREWSS